MNYHLEIVRCRFMLLSLCCLGIFCITCKGGDDSGIVGGPCTYADTPGTAKIISVNSADPNLYNCKNDPVEVIFNFTPDDPSKVIDIRDNGQHVVVGAGANPPRDYITSKGFTVGSVHQCTRQDETHGACTPWTFTFPGVDFSDYGNFCSL